MAGKPSFEEYLTAAAGALGSGDDPATAERSYIFNLRSAHQSVMASGVMSGVLVALKEMRHLYSSGRPDLLFYPADIPEDLGFLQKPFRSAIHKLYRHNIVYNRNYPNPPREGALEPALIYEKIDDLLRTRLVCKYMDGPRFVCEQLRAHCDSQGIASRFRELSTDAGYYAWHFYFQAPVELMIENIVHQKSMWVEIQMSTQLAEVITSLTHGLYEARRAGSLEAEGHNWKWDASSVRFRSAYLGHGLHLLEGIIQTFKDDMLNAARAEAATQSARPSTGVHPSPEAQPDKETIEED